MGTALIGWRKRIKVKIGYKLGFRKAPYTIVRSHGCICKTGIYLAPSLLYRMIPTYKAVVNTNIFRIIGAISKANPCGLVLCSMFLLVVSHTVTLAMFGRVPPLGSEPEHANETEMNLKRSPEAFGEEMLYVFCV